MASQYRDDSFATGAERQAEELRRRTQQGLQDAGQRAGQVYEDLAEKVKQKVRYLFRCGMLVMIFSAVGCVGSAIGVQWLI